MGMQLIAGPASGGHELALTQATSRRYTAKLRDNSELTFTVDATTEQATAITELATDVHLLWSDTTGTQIIDRLRVGHTSDSLRADEHTMTVTCLDYRAVLARRRLYSGDTFTYSADQAEIAWSLIQVTQGRVGGDLGISKGWTGTTPTGVSRIVEYAAGDSIGERIRELAENTDGFDWDITPVSSSALRLDVWPRRGTDRGVILIYGGNLVAATQREVNPADYANAIRQTGADGLTARELSAADLATRPEGRWDGVFGDTTLNTQAMLDDRAEWQLEQSQIVTPAWTVTLAQGAWLGPGHVWLGDPVRLVVKSGRLDVDVTLRVYEVNIDLDGDGGQTVSLTLGTVQPPTYARRVRDVERRLTDLERR